MRGGGEGSKWDRRGNTKRYTSVWGRRRKEWLGRRKGHWVGREGDEEQRIEEVGKELMGKKEVERKERMDGEKEMSLGGESRR